MHLTRAALSLSLVLAGLSLAPAAAAAPETSELGRILVNGVSDGDRVTFAMNPSDGTVGEPIADGEDAVYSPNGAWVVYSHDADPCTGYPICSSSPDLWIANADGTHEKFLVEAQEGETGEARNIRPDWSPDGTRILFVHPSGTSWVRADGTGLEWLSSSIYSTFSPDGTEIASLHHAERSVGEYTDRGAEVRVTDVETRETTVLATDWSGTLDGLDWSPDGNQIVYVGEDGLRIVDTASSEYRDLVSSTAVNSVQTPVFSPDGDQIAFSARSWETGEAHVYVVNADGTGLHPIADRSGSLSDWVA